MQVLCFKSLNSKNALFRVYVYVNLFLCWCAKLTFEACPNILDEPYTEQFLILLALKYKALFYAWSEVEHPVMIKTVLL